MTTRRINPIFKLQTPLLFAHRGGAKENPESTEQAFRHAVEFGSDVLELDVQLTRDGEIVVWHGPELSNVRSKQHDFRKKTIHEVRWSELQDDAWVVHPSGDEQSRPDRKLLRLEDFFGLVNRIESEGKSAGGRGSIPCNIELKESEKKAPDWDEKDGNGAPVWDKLFTLLKAEAQKRTIVVASARYKIINKFRKQCDQRAVSFCTNLGAEEMAAYSNYMKKWTWFHTALAALDSVGVREKDSLKNIAFQTSYVAPSPKLVAKVRGDGGALHVFLTGVKTATEDLDELSADKLRGPVFEFLDMGVDGIMTDYPDKVGRLMDEWRAKHPL